MFHRRCWSPGRPRPRTDDLMTDWTRRDVLKTAGLALSTAVVSGGFGQTNQQRLMQTADLPTSGGSEAVLRQRIALDRGWRFHFGNASDPTKDFGYDGQSLYSQTGGMFEPSKADFDDTKWTQIDVPHDWAVELDFINDPSLESHGYKPLGRNYPATSIGWYRRIFEIPASDVGQRLWLEFDGVFRDSLVVLNGIYLGRHASGYTPFRYDITDIANYGRKNVLVVRVNATLGEGWWYEGAGIYRHVWLHKMNPLHVTHEGTFIVSKITQGSAVVTITTEVDNETPQPQTCRVLTSIFYE